LKKKGVKILGGADKKEVRILVVGQKENVHFRRQASGRVIVP